MPAVHTSDDGCSEDLPLAVHRVQVLQRLWHLRERRERLYDIPNLLVLYVSKKCWWQASALETVDPS